MSKATNQSILLLAIIGGCLSEISDYKMFSALYMREHTDKTYKMVTNVLSLWPNIGDRNKLDVWIKNKIDVWNEHVRKTKGYHNLVVLSSVCIRCLADLETQLNSPYKLKIIGNLRDPLEKIHSFGDPNGLNFAAYDKTSELMDFLYTVIEWEWKK